MKCLALLFLCLSAATLGCGYQSSTAPGPVSSKDQVDDKVSSMSRKVVKTARIVCDQYGTRLQTPEVEAQRDGVHFVIDNRLGADAGYSVKLPEGMNMGDNAPAGKSSHVGRFPPGTVEIGCDGILEGGTIGDTDYVSLEVLADSSGYKSVRLDCPSGEAVSGSGSYSGSAGGEKGDPVELFRREFSKQLKKDDAVEPAGYPESRGYRYVRVVREGRVVATAGYFREQGSWLEDSASSCKEF